MKTTIIILALAAAAHAGPRTSANYTILTDTAAKAGGNATSAAYTNTGSAGGSAGISTSANDTLKAGYLGQINETTGISIVNLIVGVPVSVGETATLQLAAIPVLDDGTSVLSIIPGVVWSVPGGPLSIDGSGLATAGTVFQNTDATARAVALGFTKDQIISVTNTLADNFGSYAGDALDDDWQVQYFGENNPQAAPGVDADGDAHTNAFEFAAGLVPTSNASRFSLRTAPAPGSAIKKHIVFSPIVAGSTYTVEFRTSLTSGTWQTLTGTTQSDTGAERTVVDTNATGAQKFYRVKVAKP